MSTIQKILNEDCQHQRATLGNAFCLRGEKCFRIECVEMARFERVNAAEDERLRCHKTVQINPLPASVERAITGPIGYRPSLQP